MRERIFTKLFEEAEIAKFSPTELKAYEDSRKAYRDIKNCIDTAHEEGVEQGKLLVAKKMKQLGVSLEIIANVTGFSEDFVRNINDK